MTAPTGDDVEAEARAWVGVPTFHRGRSRAGGVDCLGLILVVGWAVGALPGAIDVPDYGRLPNPRRLIRDMDANMLRLDPAEAAPGDVVGLAWGLAGQPMHLAILADYAGRRSIVHADPYVRRVVEVSFAGQWSAAFEGCPAWRFPNLVV